MSKQIVDEQDLGPSLSDRTSEVYSKLNSLCNDIDRLIQDMGLELVGKAANDGWKTIGVLNALFGDVCTARSAANKLSRSVQFEENIYKFQVFKSRFEWVEGDKKKSWSLMDGKTGKRVGGLTLENKERDSWSAEGIGSQSPLKSAKGSVEYNVKRYYAWVV